MAPRIRTIKPEVWDDEKLNTLPIAARLLFVGLITLADDEGRLRSATPRIRGQVFAYDDDVTNTQVEEWMRQLHTNNFIIRYGSEGESYTQIRNWKKHQRVDKPRASTLPAPSNTTPILKYDDMQGIPGTLQDASKTLPVRNGMEWNGMEYVFDKSNTSNSNTSLDDSVREVLTHWQNIFGKQRSAISGAKARKRTSRVRSRIAEGWTVDDLKTALDGFSRSQFHLDGGYVDIPTLLRDAEQVEKGIELANAAKPGASNVRAAIAEVEAYYGRTL